MNKKQFIKSIEGKQLVRVRYTVSDGYFSYSTVKEGTHHHHLTLVENEGEGRAIIDYVKRNQVGGLAVQEVNDGVFVGLSPINM